jgi:hypothetical protein
MGTKNVLLACLAVLLVVACGPSRSGGDSSNESTGNAFPTAGAQYVVLAWNDLGMHCLNPTYDSAVILPPFNTVQAQVIKRGLLPQVLDGSSGVSVKFQLAGNTTSSTKRSYGQFWTNLPSLFGVTRANDVGLGGLFGFTDQGLTGTMDWDGIARTFRAEGVPVVPVFDDGTWSPFQQALVTVTLGGATIAQTRAMVPTSDEINCAKCHAPGGTQKQTFEDILRRHDSENGTKLLASEPVLCASCHGSPALGATTQGSSGIFLSRAIHGFHSAEVSPPPACYDCHPGTVTKCSRSDAHATADGNCTSCHGTLSNVASTISAGRMPWGSEPKCGDCHKSQASATLGSTAATPVSTIAEVDTGTALYRNSLGHGGLVCSACHGSPHAMVPSREANDNYQAIAYQGKAFAIGACEVCHPTSRGGGSPAEFMNTHGGTTPEQHSACAVCHTAIPSVNTDLWPHKFQWRSR